MNSNKMQNNVTSQFLEATDMYALPHIARRNTIGAFAYDYREWTPLESHCLNISMNEPDTTAQQDCNLGEIYMGCPDFVEKEDTFMPMPPQPLRRMHTEYLPLLVGGPNNEESFFGGMQFPVGQEEDILADQEENIKERSSADVDKNPEQLMANESLANQGQTSEAVSEMDLAEKLDKVEAEKATMALDIPEIAATAPETPNKRDTHQVVETKR